MRKFAPFVGRSSTNTPSAPTPRCRSQIFEICSAASCKSPARLSIMTKSLPAPFIFVKRILGLALFLGAREFSFAQIAPGRFNDLIVEQIQKMPTGGRYSASRVATIRLQSAAHFESGKFFVLPNSASPSYCSGATYLVFMKTIEALRARGSLHLD